VRVLVTGGSGFVGSAFVSFAGASGWEVIAGSAIAVGKSVSSSITK